MNRSRDVVIALIATVALTVVLASSGFIFGPFETLAVGVLGVTLFAALRVREARRRRRTSQR